MLLAYDFISLIRFFYIGMILGILSSSGNISVLNDSVIIRVRGFINSFCIYVRCYMYIPS